MAGASEDGCGDGLESSRRGRFTEPALLHEAGTCGGSGVARVKADELFKVRQHEAEGAAGTKVGEDVIESDAELVEGHVLENVGAVDSIGRLRGDGKAFDDVAVTDVFGIGWEAFFYQKRGEKRQAALQPEGGAGVEVEPGFRCAHATAKLHVRVIHRPYYYIAWKMILARDCRCSAVLGGVESR